MSNTNQGKEITFVNEFGEKQALHWSRNNNKFVVKQEPRTIPRLITMAINQLIGQKIRAARQAAGMTGKQVAEKAGIASGRTAKCRMYEIEKGRTYKRTYGIKMGTLYAIAYAIGITPDQLLPDIKDVLKLANIKEVETSHLSINNDPNNDDTEYEVEIRKVG